jgi:2-methylcitrate dehydratase PrpD
MNKYLPVLIRNMEEKIKEKTSEIENISIETKKEGSSNYGKTKNKNNYHELAAQ